VDKEAELCIAEPLKALFELLWGFVELRCGGWLRCYGSRGNDFRGGRTAVASVTSLIAIRAVLFFA